MTGFYNFAGSFVVLGIWVLALTAIVLVVRSFVRISQSLREISVSLDRIASGSQLRN